MSLCDSSAKKNLRSANPFRNAHLPLLDPTLFQNPKYQLTHLNSPGTFNFTAKSHHTISTIQATIPPIRRQPSDLLIHVVPASHIFMSQIEDLIQETEAEETCWDIPAITPHNINRDGLGH